MYAEENERLNGDYSEELIYLAKTKPGPPKVGKIIRLTLPIEN